MICEKTLENTVDGIWKKYGPSNNFVRFFFWTIWQLFYAFERCKIQDSIMVEWCQKSKLLGEQICQTNEGPPRLYHYLSYVRNIVGESRKHVGKYQTLLETCRKSSETCRKLSETCRQMTEIEEKMLDFVGKM